MVRPLFNKYFKEEKARRATEFVVKVLVIYLLWKFLFYVFNIDGTLLNSYWKNFTDWFAFKTIQPAALILQKIIGYHLVYNHRNILIENTPGFFLADHCLGISVCVIFSGFIVAYKGRWIYKLWYIPFGIFCIYAINVTRLVGLGVVEVCCYDKFFELAHTRVYLLMCYGMFFLLLILWMNYFSKK